MNWHNTACRLTSHCHVHLHVRELHPSNATWGTKTSDFSCLSVSRDCAPAVGNGAPSPNKRGLLSGLTAASQSLTASKPESNKTIEQAPWSTFSESVGQLLNTGRFSAPASVSTGPSSGAQQRIIFRWCRLWLGTSLQFVLRAGFRVVLLAVECGVWAGSWVGLGAGSACHAHGLLKGPKQLRARTRRLARAASPHVMTLLLKCVRFSNHGFTLGTTSGHLHRKTPAGVA